MLVSPLTAAETPAEGALLLLEDNDPLSIEKPHVVDRQIDEFASEWRLMPSAS